MAFGPQHYVSLADIRAAGITESVMDGARAEETALRAARAVDKICRCWFYARSFTTSDYLLRSGNGTPHLHLPAPPISVSSVAIDYAGNRQAWETQDASCYEASGEGEERNPSLLRLQGSLSLHGGGDGIITWPKGKRNVRLTGTFGWLEDDVTPPAIKDVVLRLIAQRKELAGADGADARAIRAGLVSSKKTHNRQVDFIDRLIAGSATGDAFIDQTLLQYRRSFA